MALSLQRYTHESNKLPDGLMYEMLKERSRKEREKSMMIVFEKGDELPECLIIEILSWMPVKDLLQYKSVCKSWYATISSPDFISKHLKNYYNNNDSWRSCLVVQNKQDLDDGYERWDNFDEWYFACELLIDERASLVLAYENLSEGPLDTALVYGPCDGIYYLNNQSDLRALWNPAIAEYKHLPKLIQHSNLSYDDEYEVYGFGQDPVTRDYKVVVLKGYPTHTLRPRQCPLSFIFVYSLRADSWKYCGELASAYWLKNNKCYVYVNGCCYWLAFYTGVALEQSEMIISFDMATDAYTEMDVPNYEKPSSTCLAVYDESLALFSLHKTQKNFVIWTFKEGSWTKKFKMGPLPAEVWEPIGHWKDNLIMLETNNYELVLIDPYTQQLKYLAYEGYSTCLGVFAYMESLVSFGENITSKSHMEFKEDIGSNTDDDMGFT